MEQQYSQLVRTYTMVQNQYNQMLFMAQQVPVNMILRYRVPMTPWFNSSSANLYGTTGSWTSGINSGFNVFGGYSAATTNLNAYGGGFANIAPGQTNRIATDYGTVELTDGANLAAMQTLGELRANAAAVQASIANLESDSLSADPNMNSEIAVLNKISAANIVNLRNTQDANKLLAAMAEEQIVQAKRQRDSEAQAFNEHILFMAQGNAALASQTAGASAAMMAWQMP
jgi:hypothetical protein